MSSAERSYWWGNVKSQKLNRHLGPRQINYVVGGTVWECLGKQKSNYSPRNCCDDRPLDVIRKRETETRLVIRELQVLNLWRKHGSRRWSSRLIAFIVSDSIFAYLIVFVVFKAFVNIFRLLMADFDLANKLIEPLCFLIILLCLILPPNRFHTNIAKNRVAGLPKNGARKRAQIYIRIRSVNTIKGANQTETNCRRKTLEIRNFPSQ